MNLKPLLIIGFMQVLPFPIYSQEARETKKEVFSADTEQKTELVLHFRFDRSMVDYGYRDNNRILAAMHKIFADSLCVSRIDSVCIQAFSSPEGDADYNRRLALRRAQAVKGYLVWKYPGLNQYRIRTSAQAESWDALRDVALNDTLLPCRDEILQILKLNTGEKRKEALLKKLNTGIPYRHISQWILPELRNASICTVYMRPLRHAQQGSRLVADAQGNNGKEYQKADGTEITDDTEVVNGVRVAKGNDTNANGTEVINGVRVTEGNVTNANDTEVINGVRVATDNIANANGTETVNGVRVTKGNDTNANGTEVINGVRVAKGNDTNANGTEVINGVRVAKGNDTNANGTELTDNTAITGSTQVTGNAQTTGSANAIAPGKSRRRPLFAVKTNLLFDAALMPNIELEVPIGKRWSLNGEYMFPWWLINDDRYCLQILMGGLEVRYRPGKRSGRDVLTGHFIGLYAGGGKYDLQWDKNGYQGEFFIAAGVSYGYAHSIARNLRLEYNIGIGMLRTDYRHYHSRDNHRTLLWQENGEYTWLGPTKLKISLVWLITGKNKK
ncbi:DUF3575 domain-containing protein [Bacteroides clarus]|jgi:hypothetical protein|uniref:DUF3575 domain-containing protein n=1 Tax=Bacteroides clarus TaxID=626929 RepID=UPI00266B6E1F|nr:DUF3575 domain-containing protein [Bacteroides clarus]